HYVILNGTEGEIASPGFPNTYHDTGEYHWTVYVPSGMRISVRFLAISITTISDDYQSTCRVEGVWWGTKHGSLGGRGFRGIPKSGPLGSPGTSTLYSIRISTTWVKFPPGNLGRYHRMGLWALLGRDTVEFNREHDCEFSRLSQELSQPYKMYLHHESSTPSTRGTEYYRVGVRVAFRSLLLRPRLKFSIVGSLR
ncbi:hypothetical protein TNIN_121561, partial [Trichonephila inaurata madagascariensis]